MTNRRMDAVYFTLLLAVGLIGYTIANRPEEQVATLEFPIFEPPEIELEEPFAFPYAVLQFKKRNAPTLKLSGNFESVLNEVRSALLESSSAGEIKPPQQFVSMLDSPAHRQSQ